MTAVIAAPGGKTHHCRLVHRRWFTKETFAIELQRPPGFQFRAGQRIRVLLGEQARDYSPIPGIPPNRLTLLIRSMARGIVSTHLAACPLDTTLMVEEPSGHFIYRPSSRPAVFIATGTGIAPFVAMREEGVKGFIMLHGVREAGELYFRDRMEPQAERYIPCLSGQVADRPPGVFQGRVTAYLKRHLPSGSYDFYLAGRREMIAEALATVDDRFPSSRVYSEIFF